MLELSAVLMAGGESRRMGKDKGEIIINSEPLWQHQLSLLQSQKPLETFISSKNKKDWELPEGVNWLLDKTAGKGPLCGLQAALDTARGSHILMLGIDMPEMTDEMLMKIVDATSSDKGTAPIHKGFYEPMAAIYPISAKKYVDNCLEGDNYSFQFLLKQLVSEGLMDEYEIDEKDLSCFKNANTPDSLN